LASFVVFLAVIASPAFGGEAKYTAYGYGSVSCGKWLANSSNEILHHTQTTWFLGWVSAAGFYDALGDLQATDRDAMVEWTNNYCHQHPLDQLVVAAERLVYTLASRKRASAIQ
jgi:hypothetical protein